MTTCSISTPISLLCVQVGVGGTRCPCGICPSEMAAVNLKEKQLSLEPFHKLLEDWWILIFL